jgi:hypothetical protein
MKICTLSPQGNGVRCGGITRFSGALHSKDVDNFFWELSQGSWNAPFIDWEGTPFKLETEEDEIALKAKLESYDVIVSNWPTMTTNEHNSYRLWNVWKNLENPLKVSIIHNTILTAVRKENLSPLVWSSSDYILIQVSEESTICQELIKTMPWLNGKIRQFRQVLDIDEFEERIENSLDVTAKDDLALWVGRWENCRNTARWGKVLKDANEMGHKSPYLHCAMGLESDVKTYWGYFANDKGNHVRLNSHEVKEGAAFLSDYNGQQRIDREKLSSIYTPEKLNDLLVFGRYEYKTGMDLLQSAKWGISIFGAWKEDLVQDYVSLAKLEYASLEIMLLSLPVFDHRHLSTMSETELFNSPWMLKAKHDASPEENVALLRRMEEIASNPSLYREYREANIDYVKRKHSAQNFIDLINECLTDGKTPKLSEKEILHRIYGEEVAMTPDLWVSMQHTQKKIPHYISWEPQGEKKPDKMKIAPRRKLSELF